jgi:hypothetical protein
VVNLLDNKGKSLMPTGEAAGAAAALSAKLGVASIQKVLRNL